MQKSRLVYARFCVNVVLNQALLIVVTLKYKWGERSQPIEYKNVGIFYQKCGQYGHLIVNYNAQLWKEKQRE